jgi:cytochrome P450
MTGEGYFPAGSLVGHGTTRTALGSRPPGPRGRRGIGVLPEYMRDPFEYVRACSQEYGDVFRLPLPFREVVFANHPDHVAHVMNHPDGIYSMIGPAGPLARRLVGASIPMMEGEPFRERRKLIAPMFGGRSMGRLADELVDEFVTRIDAWDRFVESGETIDLQHEISKVTLPAFMRAMFSIRVTDREIHDLDVDLRAFLRMIAAAAYICTPPNLVPLPGVESLPRSYRRVRRWISGLIDARIANQIDGHDMLQALLDARYDDGAAISRKDLITEIMILIAGGYETVVASLSWTLALLAEHPEAHQKLLSEIDLLGGAPPRFPDLHEMTWSKACFDEGQRLQGHPINPRFAMADDEIDGYRIPRGTVVGVSLHTLHRDPRWWPDPERYDPTRFTDRAVIDARPKHAFIPFGAGPHRCIGSALGYMNGQFLMALIYQRYHLRTPPGWTPRHASTFSITIKGGLPVTLTRAEARCSR